MSEILVVGGAGYIGSHMVKCLRQHGYKVIVLDDLSGGYREAVLGAELVEGSISDRKLLDDIFGSCRIEAVMHFASFIQVGESVSNPGKYYVNNVAATLNLLEAMRNAGILRFIFSSTAAVYGEPQYSPIDEVHPKAPINPYGRSKWMLEQVLQDFDSAYGMRSVCLRYFNAAGADPDGELGECHLPETHLIPLVLQAASGRRKAVSVFGTDYDTPDGTCIRDYVHVSDLSTAHLRSLEHLMSGGASSQFNLGNGEGFSVAEVIDCVRKVTGTNIAVVNQARRSGDPARLVANAELAKTALGWKPVHFELEKIVTDAWRWEQKHPWF